MNYMNSLRIILEKVEAGQLDARTAEHDIEELNVEREQLRIRATRGDHTHRNYYRNERC